MERIIVKKLKLKNKYRYLMKCLICKKHFEIKLGRFNEGRGRFCSLKCWYQSSKMTNSPNWKGGKMICENRFYIYNPQHPNAPKRGYIHRYHLVAEKCLGRYLTKQEIIHHIDGNSLNDNPENLYLFSSHSEHRKFGHLKNKLPLKSNITQAQLGSHSDL